MSEMSCPLKKSWKLRWRRARKVAGNPIVRAAEPFRVCSSEFAVVDGLLKSFNSFFRMSPLDISIHSGSRGSRRVDDFTLVSIEAGYGFGLESQEFFRLFPYVSTRNAGRPQFVHNRG
jgi:hypothetical protein